MTYFLRFALTHLFSLRLVVGLMAVVFALVGPELPLLAVVDRALFSLMGETRGNTGVAAMTALAPEAFAEALAARGLVEPQWSAVVIRAGLVASAIFLVLALPRLGAAVALPVVLLMAGGLMVLQVVMMFYQNAWLPLGEVALLLLAGYLLMLFWLQPYREIHALRHDVRQARHQLGRVLLQQGRPDEAFEALVDCPPTEEILGVLYDIAIAQERKRHYESAARTLGHINDHKRGYRDVKQRLEALGELTSDSPGAASGGFEATRTLVLPERSVSRPTISRPTLGRYEIEREIGRGAMGVVYLGKDPKIARTVAIKTLSYQAFDDPELQDLKDRFFREAEAAGRLNHPAIVTVYDVGEEEDLAFIAMDFAHGRPLSDFCKPGRLLPLATVLDVVARVADALDYAHRQKIVHRDIKPGNLIYNPKSGDIKITDFGIAKISDDSRTRTGSVMGSPLYMSPEQLKGRKVSGASDIYSLGVTLYKLVSGETPFQGDTLANLTYQILNKRPRSVREFNPDLPNGVVRLINKAIQREPDKRFDSAATMAEAVRRLAAREARTEASG